MSLSSEDRGSSCVRNESFAKNNLEKCIDIYCRNHNGGGGTIWFHALVEVKLLGYNIAPPLIHKAFRCMCQPCSLSSYKISARGVVFRQVNAAAVMMAVVGRAVSWTEVYLQWSGFQPLPTIRCTTTSSQLGASFVVGRLGFRSKRPPLSLWFLRGRT